VQVKFGVQVPQEGLTYEEIKRYFISLEKLGFYSAFVYDHFHPIWKPEDAMVFENWILLSALAKETEKIRIGTLVNCNSYRYPSVTAKMAASLDNVSNGRLEFMIGGGWYEGEYKAYGIPFPPAKVRIEQMKEAIQVIKIMWTEHKAHFKGKYYNLDGAISYPKPLQKPYPRIWVGGGGEKFTLRAIAEVGEGTNFFGTPKIFEGKLALLQNYCEKVGRDYNTIEKSWTGDLIIGTKDHEEMEDARLTGTPSQIISRIEEYLKLGVNYFIILASSRSHPDLMAIDQMELFAKKVVGAFV
jgi:F420-dependent oxidoreductase-like protein